MFPLGVSPLNSLILSPIIFRTAWVKELLLKGVLEWRHWQVLGVKQWARQDLDLYMRQNFDKVNTVVTHRESTLTCLNGRNIRTFSDANERKFTQYNEEANGFKMCSLASVVRMPSQVCHCLCLSVLLSRMPSQLCPLSFLSVLLYRKSSWMFPPSLLLSSAISDVIISVPTVFVS